MPKNNQQASNGPLFKNLAATIENLPPELSPETRLWFAVLAQAVQDATARPRGVGGSSENTAKVLHGRAVNFCVHQGGRYVFACDACNLDPDVFTEMTKAKMKEAGLSWDPAPSKGGVDGQKADRKTRTVMLRCLNDRRKKCTCQADFTALPRRTRKLAFLPARGSCRNERNLCPDAGLEHLEPDFQLSSDRPRRISLPEDCTQSERFSPLPSSLL